MGRVKGHRKCCVCEKMFSSDLIDLIDGKNYCSTCGKKRLKEIEKNKELNDYLYKLAGDKDLMPFWCRQVKAMKDENGWKTESIIATLKYMFEIREHPPTIQPEYGIRGLIEAYYYSAKKYYEEFYALKNIPKETIEEILLMKPKEIRLKRSEMIKRDILFTEKKKDLSYGPELDMDDIIDDDEFYEWGETN